MNKKIGIGIAIVLLVVVAIIITQVGNQKEEKVIRIGAISPFSGDGANYGKSARTAIDLAVDEINAQGGINGDKLVIEYEDDKGTPKDAVSAFKKLATVHKVSAVLGPFYSSNVLACAPEANRLRVVLLTGTATSDNIRDAGEYIFRVCPSNDAQSQTIADFAYKQLSLKTSFILYRNVDYGVTLRDEFEKAFKELGGSIIGAEAIPPEATDVRGQLTKIESVKPDFIFAAVHYPEGSTILRQAKELGISAVIIGTDGGYDPELIKIAGESAEGSYWVTIGWEENEVVSKFKKAYQARYGEAPGVYSGLYYDATHVLAKALSAVSNIDGPSVRDALSKTVYEGPTGITKFDAVGDVSKTFSVYQVKDGDFLPVKLAD